MSWSVLVCVGDNKGSVDWDSERLVASLTLSARP